MLQRRLRPGEVFEYRHQATGEPMLRVKVLEIRRRGQVVLGLEAADGWKVVAEPNCETSSYFENIPDCRSKPG